MTLTTHSLADHPDHQRIHKLLYFVHTQSWVADAHRRRGMSIDDLLSVLWDATPSIEQLQRRLIRGAEQLNKPNTYLRVAHSIIAALHAPCPEPALNSPLPVDGFQLRYSLMQAINPFKAKIVLLALGDGDNVQQQPSISQFSLDELLIKTLQLYPSLSALEAKLRTIGPLHPGISELEQQQLTDTLKTVLSPYLPLDLPQSPENLDVSQESLCTILMTPNS